MLSLHNCAISTSGDSHQFVEIGGKRYSHIVNPKTGLGLITRVAATIIAPHGITTDSLSTALSVADSRSRRRLGRAFPQARAFIRTVHD
jgi:thiamine biosynthesis lipoprotein